MEQLNQCLKTLLSSCSEELRLEPDKNPYLVSENRTTDLANTPLMGTQISTMVFPLIPPAAKSALPNSPEIEFVHPHNLGNFNFTVQKSSAGFVVTIRPMLNGSDGSVAIPKPLPDLPSAPPVDLNATFINEQPTVESIPVPQPVDELPSSSVPVPAPSYQFESSSLDFEQTASESVENASLSNLIFDEKEQAAQEYVASDIPEVEVVDVNDPQFQTVFSDTSTYEPPGRRDDFSLEIADPSDDASYLQETFTAPAPAYEPKSVVPPPAATPEPADSKCSGCSADCGSCSAVSICSRRRKLR